tara:strand:+ start:23 stop:688 length:666 start_codon:yes stop_codon:yes gene_type:complete
MPRYSKKEFIDLCFITHATLSMNIKRKKVIPNSHDEIDTALAINNDFLLKYIEKNKQRILNPNSKKKKGKSNKIATPSAPLPVSPPVKQRDVTPEDLAIEAKAVAVYDLDKQKKLLEIEKLENENKISKIKLDKMNGVVIPTDLVMVLFGQHSKSLTTAFHQAAENFVVEMAQAYGVDKKSQAKMRGDLIAVVNKAIEDSLEISRDGIDNVVDEYAINGKG